MGQHLQRLLSPARQPPLWQNEARQIHVRIGRYSRRLSSSAKLTPLLDFPLLLRQDAAHSCTKAHDAFHGLSAHPPLRKKRVRGGRSSRAGEREEPLMKSQNRSLHES